MVERMLLLMFAGLTHSRRFLCLTMVMVAAVLTSGGAAKTQGAYSVFHSFLVVDFPLGTLIQGADGNLYGTTFQGGFFRKGTVFRMTTAGALTFLHEFTGLDGATPRAGLLQAAD